MRTIDMRDDPGSLQDNVVPALARRPDESTRESPIVLGDARVIAPRDRKAVSVRAWHEHRKGQFWVAPLIVIHVVHVEEPAVTIPGNHCDVVYVEGSPFPDRPVDVVIDTVSMAL